MSPDALAAVAERPGATSGGSPAPLDDVMLAMDVVDTLRRRRQLVERELEQGERDADLKARLRRIYGAQGIEVSDAVIEEGVRALKEDRFVYRAPPDSLGVRLARLYVSRGAWGPWALGALAAIALGIGAWQILIVGPRQALPETLAARHAEVLELAREPQVDALADALLRAGELALRDDDRRRAREALDQLDGMREQLAASFRVQVVNRPGERSGVWRIPDVNPDARNYYLIVEAVDATGRRVETAIENEETGETERVETWGLRVDERTFRRVAADKEDDGIIQADVLGRKEPGDLEPVYEVQTSGAGITRW